MEGVKVIGNSFCWLWNKLKELFRYFSSFKQSKTLPPAQQLGPKPFSPDSPSFTKVAFDPDATFEVFKKNLDVTVHNQLEENTKEEDYDERSVNRLNKPEIAWRR